MESHLDIISYKNFKTAIMIMNREYLELRNIRKDYLMKVDEWMTCDFTSFSTVFQSYQDDRRMVMKGCVQWNPIYG